MSRSVLPPGRAGLVILAAVIAPAVLKKCRPLTRRLGQGIVKFGEKLRDYAGDGTSNGDDAPNADVKSDSTATTKVGAATKEAAVNTAAPPAQEEVEAHVAAEVKGAATVPKSPERKKRVSESKTKPDQPLNPKRTAVTPPKSAPPKSKKRTPGESN